MDKQKAEQAVRDLLVALGEDVEREGLCETPERVARMYEELLAGYSDDEKTYLSKTFATQSGEAVAVRDIAFSSLCEHHLMPFFGTVSIAYLPGERVVGLSKLARTVEVYARRLQLQERMTAQIADAVYGALGARGVLVTCEAEHTCMTCRGVKKFGAKTETYAFRGELTEEERRRLWEMCR